MLDTIPSDIKVYILGPCFIIKNLYLPWYDKLMYI